jgi:hypothetical protein
MYRQKPGLFFSAVSTAHMHQKKTKMKMKMLDWVYANLTLHRLLFFMIIITSAIKNNVLLAFFSLLVHQVVVIDFYVSHMQPKKN